MQKSLLQRLDLTKVNDLQQVEKEYPYIWQGIKQDLKDNIFVIDLRYNTILNIKAYLQIDSSISPFELFLD